MARNSRGSMVCLSHAGFDGNETCHTPLCVGWVWAGGSRLRHPLELTHDLEHASFRFLRAEKTFQAERNVAEIFEAERRGSSECI